jgi:predicted transcriptional regulator
MTANQEVIVGFQNLLCLLSRTDNLKMFAIAKEGLMISSSTLDTLRMTPKRYYRALKQLKDAGLIEKDKKKLLCSHNIWIHNLSKNYSGVESVHQAFRKNADDRYSKTCGKVLRSIYTKNH